MAKRRVVHNEEELADAMNDDTVEEVEIHGDMTKQIVDIKAKGKVTWGVVIGCFAVAITAILAAPATAGTSSLVAMPVLAPAVSILGLAAVGFLVRLVIITKSIDIIKRIYNNMSIDEIAADYIIIHKTK